MDNITIMTPEGATLMVAQIGVNSIYHNELEGDEYVSLEWEDYEFQRLEVGCYVVYENKVYRLTEPHEPSRRAEDVFVYTPVFYPSQYHWRKAQACFYTYDGDITINKTETSVSVNVNKAITSRELDWSFTGDFKDALSMLLQAIKNETNEVWVAMFPAEIGAKLVKIEAQGLSIFDMLGQIVEQAGKEFWFENSGNTHNIHIGTLEISTSGDHTDGEGRVVLNVGEDITNPNVTSEPKEYFTRFYFFGSNRNIEQPNSITKSSVVNRRLPLNPAKQAAPYADMKAYPQGFIDIDVNPATSYPNGIYTPTLPAYKIFSQSVFFDDIYPHCNYKVKAVEQTEIPVKDEAGKETGERMPIYFVSLYDAADQTKSPIPFNDWVGEVGNVMGSMLPALVPAIAFRSGYLQGLEFDVHYRKAGTKPYSNMANPLQYNCFEVIFDTNSNPRIPNGTIKPLAEDACTLLNIKMPESYIRTAQQELETKALEYIAEQGKDKSTYDANSDPRMFENCPALLGLEIGAKAKLVYPNGSGVVLSRVVVIERHLDIPSDCKITLGYRARQGSIQTLRALVEDTSSKAETVMAANNLSQRRINEMHNGFVAQKEAFDSYFDTETGEFDGSHIKPSTVQAGALSVGARNQQFSLSGIGFSCDVVRSNVNNTVTWSAGSLSHYTIQDSGVKTWTITSGTAALTANSLYYIYAKVSRTGSTGTISITTTQYRFDQVANYYYFLIGTVSSRLVSSGTGETTLYCRLFSTSYGTTSINGREITTGAIKSADGSTIFDLDKSEIIGNIRFKSGTQGMTELNTIIGENSSVVAAGEAAEDAQAAAANAILAAQAAKTTADAAALELSDYGSDSKISPTEKTALKQQLADINSEYTAITNDAAKYNLTGDTAYTQFVSAKSSAVTALNKYTASTPAHITIESDYANIAAYYPKRQALLDKIAAAVKTNAKDVYCTCSTAAATQQKAVTVSKGVVDTQDSDSSKIETGATIVVKFTNENTHATPKLKVGSFAAAEIRGEDGTWGVDKNWAAGQICMFTFDGTYWVLNGAEALAAKYGFDNLAIGGRNLFQNTESRHFSLFSSPTVTFTDNVEVTEWNTSKGIRAAGTKGSNNIYGTYQSPTNQHWGARQYVVSIYIKNLGQTRVTITQNGNSSNRCVWEVGEEGRKFFIVGNNSTAYNMGFNFVDPDNVSGYAFDFVYWHPKVEEGNVPTDWTPAPEDTEAAIANLGTELKEQIDGKIETWSQSTDPSTDWTTTKLKDSHVGDLWYYTGVTDNSHTNNKTYKYTKSGSSYSWVEYSAGGGDLFDKIDGKSTIYYGAKSGSYPNKRVGDFLFDNTTGNEGKSYRWSGTAWVTVQDYQAAIQSGLNSLQIGGRNLLAVSKAVINNSFGLTITKLPDGWFHIEGTITGTAAGLPRPLWGEYTEENTIAKGGIFTVSIETRGVMPISDKFKVQIYSYASGGTSGSWSQYITTPNGSMTFDWTQRWLLRVVMYKTADATGTEVNGDIRFKLEKGNKVTDWTPAPEDTEAELTAMQTALQAQIDGKIETWSQVDDPSTAWNTTELKDQHVDDLWYYTGETTNNRTNNKTYKYTKSGSTYSWAEHSAGGGDLFNKIKGKSTIFYNSTESGYTPSGVQDGDFLVISSGANQGKSFRWLNNAWVGVQDYQTAIQNGINSIQIGGRNLLQANASLWEQGSWNEETGAHISNATRIRNTNNGNYIPIETGKDYIFTRHTLPSASKTYEIVIYAYDNNGTFVKGDSKKGWNGTFPLMYKATTATRIEIGIRHTDNSAITVEEAATARIKLEQGNKATDWSPAPEDVNAAVTAAQNAANNANSAISNMTDDVVFSKIEKKSFRPEWKNIHGGLTASSTYTSDGSYAKALAAASGTTVETTTLTNAYDALKSFLITWQLDSSTDTGTSSNPFSQSSLGEKTRNYYNAEQAVYDALAEYWSATKAKEATDNLEIGGRNLLRGTQNLTFVSSGGNWPNAKFYKSGTGTIENVQILLSPIPAITNGIKLTTTTANTIIGFAQSGVPLNKKTLTISVWVKGTANDKVVLQPLYSSTSGAEENGNKEFTIPDSDWHLYEWSKTPNYAHQSGIAAGYVYLKSATVGNSCLVCGLKLEYGNKSTDWSPAQEDNEDFVRQQRAEIENGTQYLKDALRGARTGETIMDGGLVLSTMIGVMNQSGNVQAALNGAAANSEPIIMGGMARVSGMPLGTFRVYPDGHLEIHETEAEMIYIDKGEIQFKASTGIRNRITTASMGTSGISTAESTITSGSSTTGSATLIAATTGSAKVITLKEEGTWSQYVPYQNGANTAQAVVEYDRASAMLINSGNLTLTKTGTLVFNAFSVIIENVTDSAISVPSGYNGATDDGIKLMYKEQYAFFASADVRTWVAISLFANGSLAHTFYSESMGLVTSSKTISIPQVTITGLPPASYTLAIAVEVNGGSWNTQFEKDPTWQTHFVVETNRFSAKTAYRAKLSSAVTCSYSYEAYQNVMFRDGLFMSKKNTDWIGLDPESRSTGYGMLAAKSSKTNAPLVNLSIGQGSTSATTRFSKSGWLQKIGTLNATTFGLVNMITLIVDVKLENSTANASVLYNPYAQTISVTRNKTGHLTLSHGIGHTNYMVLGSGFQNVTSMTDSKGCYVTFYNRKSTSVDIRLANDSSADDSEAYIIIIDFALTKTL